MIRCIVKICEVLNRFLGKLFWFKVCIDQINLSLSGQISDETWYTWYHWAMTICPDGRNQTNSSYYHHSMRRVFANGMEDLRSITSRVISKTQKMVFDAALNNTQNYKVQIKVTVHLLLISFLVSVDQLWRVFLSVCFLFLHRLWHNFMEMIL